ncbi:MAG TPA: hypothetical protein VFS67_14535 [Polyangiaceae bacterium]|jgi:hypothetical protein|nr:hypothetical protein [Polyangiaceae bacterium]
MAQAWWSTRWGKSWLSTVLFGFDQSAALGGWALRRDLVQSRFSASAEAEVGALWAALSVPVSVRLDQVQPYCAPRLGTWGSALSGFLPCGLSLGPWQGFSVRGEAELSWADFEYYNRRLHLGLAVSQQW